MSTMAAERLTALARLTGASSYLEIGVFAGDTFFALDLPDKCAVDPAFQFDHHLRDKPGERYHQMPSDDFFEQLAVTEPERVFDLIFIDGLHTYEQTLRDFKNTLRHCHAGTVWLIDDTVPCDSYSAVPDQRLSDLWRREAGLCYAGWHGDVYKVAYALHDYFPDFSYCTTVEHCTPQTVVWKAPAPRTAPPLFASKEDIRRADYFSIFHYLQAFNLRPFVEAIRHVGTHLPCPPPAEDGWKKLFYQKGITFKEKALYQEMDRLINTVSEQFKPRRP